uniref:RNA-directed DNA polymerase, eukaryota n=1 Tax=Tanacetum cinerariifolium TaxID=118510 RepID=A0A6L2L964_TANCI|nr:RNA-directed DNA polymerase, eukaryota [Tanacetum cinerariifolium]
MCNDYGTVVDVFIPNKKSKTGKRFAFVRFIKGEMLDIEDNVDSSFGRKRLCIKTKQPVSILESFKIIFKAHSPFSEEVSGDDSKSDVEEVSETIFGDNSSSPNNNSNEMGKQQSEDPFKIYDILKKQTGGETREEVYQEINRESVDPNVVKEGGYVLGVLEDIIRVSQAMGKAVGNSGGILCVWEANVFKKDYAMISDNFVAIYGTWLPSNSKILFVAIYAPQQASFKRDENSKFFHGIINKKLSQLAIRGVFDNGLWCTDPGKVKEAFFNHFEARFKKPVAHRFMLNFPFNKRLSDMQAADLERKVSRDEIRLAVWNCGENKSPGLDGYTFEFFRKYWNIVGPDFCEAVECFFETGLFSKGCNSSFVALIPKVMDAKFVSNFRPITLIGSVYKVVTKILANGLALVIADLVFDTQFAFVANRQILDGLLF